MGFMNEPEYTLSEVADILYRYFECPPCDLLGECVDDWCDENCAPEDHRECWKNAILNNWICNRGDREDA